MEEKVGSYIIDKDGNHRINADDEAMAERHGLKSPPPQSPSKGGQKKEVKKDVGK